MTSSRPRSRTQLLGIACTALGLFLVVAVILTARLRWEGNQSTLTPARALAHPGASAAPVQARTSGSVAPRPAESSTAGATGAAETGRRIVTGASGASGIGAVGDE